MSWATAKLGDVAPAKALKYKPQSESEMAWQITLDHIESHGRRILERTVAPVCDAGSSTHWFDERHVLYSKLRPYLNKVILPDGRGLGTTELVPLFPEEGTLDRKYLAYYLRSPRFVSWVSSQAAGAKMPRVSMKVFWEHEIPLPPLKEQQRIAAILDKVDAIRWKRQQAIALADEFLRAVFLDMFGDPVTNPKKWPKYSFDDVATSQLGKMLSKKEKAGLSPRKYLRNANVRWREIDVADLLEMDFSEKEMQKFELNFGDSLVCEGGEVGRCAIWRGEIDNCYYQKALHRVRPKKEFLTSEYLQEFFYWMSNNGGLVSSVSEVTFSHLTAEKLKILIVPVPPMSQQLKFKEIYDRCRDIVSRFNAMVVEGDTSYKSISQKAFVGQL